MSLTGKVFAVTGAGSGIGFATARILAERGAIVAASDITPSGLKVLKDHFTQQASTSFLVTKVDVSKRAEVESWIDEIVSKFGQLDGAANVAGYIGKDHGIRAVSELDDEEWDKIMGVNLKGCMFCLRKELQHIVDGGSIVNVASIHATTGLALHGAYAASKSGMLGLTRVAAQENGHREVRVNAINPGSIYTPMMQGWWDANNRPADAAFSEPTAFQRFGSAEEVAKLIVFLLGPDSTFITGSVYAIDGGWK